MPKFTFETIAINSTAKKKPTEQDKDTYIGLEHLDPQCLEVTRFGGDVAPIGEKLLMKKGDVLFGKRRAYQKKVGIAPFDGIFSAHGLVLRPKEEVITKEFFPFFISSDYFLDKAIEISVGSLSPTINWSDLKKLEFNIPEIDKQKEYAPILWAFNDTKNKYLKLLADLNLLINSQFIEMCKNKKEYTTISEYVDENIGLVKDDFSKDDIIKYIEISSINNQNNKIEEPTIIALRDAPTSAKYHIKKGDILVSLVRPNLKKIAVNEFDEENVVGTSGFCVLRTSGNSSIEYLKYIVLSDDFTEKMTSSATGATYPTIKKEDVLGYTIPVLSENEILTFTNSAKLIDKSKFEIEQALENLKKAQKSLLDEIFSSDNL